MANFIPGSYTPNTFNTTLTNIDDANKIGYTQNGAYVEVFLENGKFQRVILGNTQSNPLGLALFPAFDEKSSCDFKFVISNAVVKNLHITPVTFAWTNVPGKNRKYIIDYCCFYSSNNTQLTPSTEQLRLVTILGGVADFPLAVTNASNVFTASPVPFQVPVNTYGIKPLSTTIGLSTGGAVTNFDGDLVVYFSAKILPQ